MKMRMAYLMSAAALLIWGGHSGSCAELNGPMHGFFWMAGSSERQGEENLLKGMEETLTRNDLISGVCLGASWKNLEPAAGEFAWALPDAQVAIVKNHERKYKFILHLGMETPPWVYEHGAKSFASTVSNSRRPNSGEKVLIPIPWDETYQRLLKQLLGKIAERYGSDPACVAISLAGANFMSGEMHLPKQPEDVRQWEQFGDYKGKIEEAYQSLIDMYAGLFPHQQICLHVSMPLPEMEAQVDSIIQYGVKKCPAQFTVQSCQLNGRGDNTSVFSYAMVRKFQDKVHHGFQNVAGWEHGDSRQGSMEVTTLNFIHTNGEYWELWRGDGEDRELCARLKADWDEARKLGYEGYREKLLKEGKLKEKGDAE